MATTTITKKFYVDDVLTDPDTSITIAVTRSDTGATVVAAGTAMTQSDTGIYYATFTDPAYGLTYNYTIIIVHGGETYTFTGSQDGSVATTSAAYNYFGAAYTDVVAMYQEAVAADFGGQTVIETMMNRIEAEMVKKCNAWLQNSFRMVVGALAEKCGTADQVIVDVPNTGGMAYGCTSEWAAFVDWSYAPQPPTMDYALTDGDGMTVSSNAGAIRMTLDADNALAEGQTVVMSCTVDPSDSTFIIPTLRDILIFGAAALVGQQVYTPSDSPLLKSYQKLYAEALTELGDVSRYTQAVPEIWRRNEIIYQGINGALMSGEIKW